MSDDAPTQRIQTDDVQEDLTEEKQKSKGLLIGLIIAGALLLVAIVVLVFFLGRAAGSPGTPGVIGTESPAPIVSDTPSAAPSETPSATPEPEPTEEPEEPAQPPQPPATTVTVDKFKVDTPTVFCGKNGQPDDIDLFFSWATSNGERVYFGVNTNDASQAPFFDNLPLDGDTGSNFPSGYSPFQYSCGNQSLKYTITVVDGSGHKASKSVTVTDVNFNN
jgi:flagellar basal body-associated protein FliL